MAHIHRLIFLLLLAVSAWVPSVSHAIPLKTVSPGSIWAVGTIKFPSPGGVADAWCATQGAQYSGSQYLYDNGDTSHKTYGCRYTPTYGGGIGSTVMVSVVQSCPGFSTGTTTCTCIAGYSANTLTSPPSCDTDANMSHAAATGVATSVNSNGSVAAGSKPSVHICHQGYDVQGTMSAVYDGVNFVVGPFTSDGSYCTPGENSAVDTSNVGAPSASATAGGTDTPATCSASGGYWGAVDLGTGVHNVCVPAAPKAGSAGSSTSSTSTADSTTGNTTTTSKNTVCDGTNCTTTTTSTVTNTTTGAAVGSPTVGTETKPQQTYCTANPTDPTCKKDSSTFAAGPCGSPPACSGDAIQCAIAAADFKTSCAFDNSAAATTEENAYTAAKAVTGDRTTDASINTTQNLSAASFDMSDSIGGGAGVSDLTVTVMNRSITLPLTGLNTWFQALGYLLVAVTSIYCYRIVARG